MRESVAEPLPAHISERNLVIEWEEFELRAVLLFCVLEPEPLGDPLAVAVPNALAQFIKEFIDGQCLFGRPVIGDVGVGEHQDLR